MNPLAPEERDVLTGPATGMPPGPAGGPAPLTDLVLSRGRLDRAAELRGDDALIGDLLADPTTRVLPVRGDRAPVLGPDQDPPDGAAGADGTDLPLRLGWRAPQPHDERRTAIFLGHDAGDGTPRGGPAAYLAVVEDGVAPPHWRTLREAGVALGDLDAAAFTTALALANWHATHRRCPRCGGPTEPVQGGWVRRCPADGSDHFPRTDPAVIVSVIDDTDRLLLGRGRTWPPGRFSVLAGFVEPGESLEAAVVREIAEESGVVVADVRYLGSQPWPFPNSLMVGMTARALTTDLRPDLDEMAEVIWVDRADYLSRLRDGRILTPGGISIARRLIERWLGCSVEQAAGRPVP